MMQPATWSLWNNKPLNDYDINTLAKIETLITDMTKKHSKVLFIRFDVRFPQAIRYPSDNDIFSQFIARFIKKQQRRGLDPAYLWVREQDSSINHHYHCILLLNGHKVNKGYPILLGADALWSQTLGTQQQGLVHFCNRAFDGSAQPNGLMIRRDKLAKEGVEEQCLDWGSYLAKKYSKDGSLYSTRSVGNSRIPQSLYQEVFQKYQYA